MLIFETWDTGDAEGSVYPQAATLVFTDPLEMERE